MDEEKFEKNFSVWSARNEYATLVSEWFDSDMEIPLSFESQKIPTVEDFSKESESEQMSPLIYDSSSEDEMDFIIVNKRSRTQDDTRSDSQVNKRFKTRESLNHSSEIQVFTQKPSSPIFISSDSSGESTVLFSEGASIIQSMSNGDDLLKALSQKLFSETIVAQSTPAESRLRENDSPNTFEITKNSAFTHRLQIRDGQNVTPAAVNDTPRSSYHDFYQARVLVRRLNDKQISEIQKKLREEAISNKAGSSNKDACSEIRTPEKRLQLTPSKRSCVRNKSPQTSPWIKRRNSNMREGYTPRSRRKLEKWFHSIHNNDVPKRNTLYPRSFMGEYLKNIRKSQTSSPSIFSSEDE